MKRKIVQVGASLCILLPKEVTKALDWDFGKEIDLILDEEGKKIILRNQVKEKKEEASIEDFDGFVNQYKEVFDISDGEG